MDDTVFLEAVGRRAPDRPGLAGAVAEAVRAGHSWSEIARRFPSSTADSVEQQFRGAAALAAAYERILRLIVDVASVAGWSATTAQTLDRMVADDLVTDEVRKRVLLLFHRYGDLLTERWPMTDLEIDHALDDAVSLASELYLVQLQLASIDSAD